MNTDLEQNKIAHAYCEPLYPPGDADYAKCFKMSLNAQNRKWGGRRRKSRKNKGVKKTKKTKKCKGGRRHRKSQRRSRR